MNTEQHEMYEYARRRIKQKKRLYFHFVLFFIGSIFIFAINKWMNIGEPTNWYIWGHHNLVFLFYFTFHKSLYYR